MQKRVLDVGNCSADHAAIRSVIARGFAAEVVQAHGLDDALAALRDGSFALVLVNRKLDHDFSDGLRVIQTIKSGKPKVIVPGNGDRVWAMTQDDEMLFTSPSEKLNQIVEGLQATHQAGIRYPIPVDVRHEPTLPPQLRDTDARLKKERGIE